MIPGVKVSMGGKEFEVPPLTLGQLRRLMPKVRLLTEIDTSMGEEQIGILIELVTAALNRNYPDITAEQVENLLDLGNAQEVMSSILTGSGLKLRTGERQPVAGTNGASFSGTSPPAADTPTL
jgi:hypothetical protein